jgi:hypothetical protein
MPKDPTGKRPTPTIATGKGNSWDTDPHGGTDHSRKSATKSPTGSRPDPGILNLEHAPVATVPGPVKKPIKHTGMPTPNKDRTTGAPKSEGGGSY